MQTPSIDSKSKKLKIDCKNTYEGHSLKILKQKLQEESNTSDLWYLRQKVQHFETTLRSVESFYTSTYKQLSLLEEQLLSHCKSDIEN